MGTIQKWAQNGHNYLQSIQAPGWPCPIWTVILHYSIAFCIYLSFFLF